ncbi:hypothetical protein KXQ82_04485 [Mucilaginibacter sp. HMF5004]|uniref:hypothetical protein n=1 Tax=Mucilaginibacter rivuli TaxID=2857527 RepID=UPI001C5D3E50|nr:hypothetical protein [Mucilaginibacter rivuli]MBW4888955.1 hypothetical protein [Mucilaginibacter rivuli]
MRTGPIPYMTIEGTVFEVDIERQVLIERANSANTISFIDEMEDKGTYYSLVYDLERKRAYDKTNGFYESEDWTAVKVPMLIELDPEGMAKKYGYTVEQLEGKTDMEVIVDQQLLAKRLHGALPTIDICGSLFYIDVRLQELRAVDEHWTRIDLKTLGISTENGRYQAFYHPGSREVADIDTGLTRLPEGVVLVEIPHDLELDPVAVGRQHDLDQNTLLRQYPIQKELKAEVVPLSATMLPGLVRRNLEKLQQQHGDNARRAKPGKRQRL